MIPGRLFNIRSKKCFRKLPLSLGPFAVEGQREYLLWIVCKFLRAATAAQKTCRCAKVEVDASGGTGWRQWALKRTRRTDLMHRQWAQRGRLLRASRYFFRCTCGLVYLQKRWLVSLDRLFLFWLSFPLSFAGTWPQVAKYAGG